MSTDTVDLLHAAEDEIGRLRALLDDIHRAMVFPFDWSSDTPDAVASILAAEGYTWPSEERSNALEDYQYDPKRSAQLERVLERYRPARYTRFDCGCQTGDFDDCDDTCGCPCGQHPDD